MRLLLLTAVTLPILTSLATAATPTDTTRTARAHLTKSCATCHTLEVVAAQKLTRSEWDQELTKMQAMGARIPDRRLLLEYLTQTFGPTKVESRNRSKH